MIDLTPIFAAVISLAVAALTVFVIPWLKTKTTTNEMEQLLRWVDVAVMAAQQLYHSSNGRDRLEYAMSFLEDKGYDVNDQEIRDAIEAAVLKLHQQLEAPNG